MKWLALGRWSSSSGRWFIRERVYNRHSPFAFGWTPFVTIRKRYK